MAETLDWSRIPPRHSPFWPPQVLLALYVVRHYNEACRGSVHTGLNWNEAWGFVTMVLPNEKEHAQ